MKEFLSYGSHKVRRLDVHKNQGLEITYVPQGEVNWTVNDRLERIRPGTIFFTLPWHAHGAPMTRQPDIWMQWVLVRLDRCYQDPCSEFRFPSALTFPRRLEKEVSRALCHADHLAWPATAQASGLLVGLIAELERPSPFTDIMVRNLFQALCIELLRILRQPDVPSGLTASEETVRRFLHALRDELATPWALQTMAERCGMKRTQFSDTVRRITGDSPVTFLNRLRIEQACECLINSEQGILDIALDCGFGSSQYFARVFRQFTDTTPTAFRDQSRLEAPRTDPALIPWRSEDEERQRRGFYAGRPRPD